MLLIPLTKKSIALLVAASVMSPQLFALSGSSSSRGFAANTSQGFGSSSSRGFGANSSQDFGSNSSQNFGSNSSQDFGSNSSQDFGSNSSQDFGSNSSQDFGSNSSSNGATPPRWTANWTPFISYSRLSWDADSDGIPDTAEDDYGLNSGDPSDAQLDADGDGISNLDEGWGGSNFNDPNSKPAKIGDFSEGFENGWPAGFYFIDSDGPASIEEGGDASQHALKIRPGAPIAGGGSGFYLSGNFPGGALTLSARMPDDPKATGVLSLAVDNGTVNGDLIHLAGGAGWQHIGINVPAGFHTLEISSQTGSAVTYPVLIDNVAFRANMKAPPAPANLDPDGDYLQDSVDNCPNVTNQDQEDSDGDGVGNACDADYLDSDGDLINIYYDNCPLAFNPDQLDSDGNGVGDACENNTSSSSSSSANSSGWRGHSSSSGSNCFGWWCSGSSSSRSSSSGWWWSSNSSGNSSFANNSSSLGGRASSSSSSAGSKGLVNLLSSDGSFAKGKQKFVTHLKDAKVSWKGEFKTAIAKASAQPWDVQLLHPTATVAGQQYSICFDGKATDNRDITVNVDSGPGDSVSLKGGSVTAKLTKTYKPYAFTFTAKATDSSARLTFNLGKSLVNASLDNIGLYAGGQCPKSSAGNSTSSSSSSSSSRSSSSSSSSSASSQAVTCGSSNFNKTAVKGGELSAVAGDCIKLNKAAGTLQIGSWSGVSTAFNITTGPQNITNSGASFTPVPGVANGTVYIKVKTAPKPVKVKFDYW